MVARESMRVASPSWAAFGVVVALWSVMFMSAPSARSKKIDPRATACHQRQARGRSGSCAVWWPAGLLRADGYNGVDLHRQHDRLNGHLRRTGNGRLGQCEGDHLPCEVLLTIKFA